jgi:type I restriction enzyme M protein
VQKSTVQRNQSKQLLEIAKTGVEKAIETNEEKAENWINEEVKKLDIKL